MAELNEANAIMASAGAMALGLILLAAGVFVRLQEAHQIRVLDAELALTEHELQAALDLSKDLRKRFDAAEAPAVPHP